MRKYYILLLGFICAALPRPTFATVCGVMPGSYELALSIIDWVIRILLLAVIVSGIWYLYAYFAEKESGWGGHYFWWLFSALILAIAVYTFVFILAPQACGVGPSLTE